MIERLYAELKAEGERGLAGTAIVYGDVATFPWGQERFAAGAFAPIGDVLLNAQHDRTTPLARTGGAGLELRDDAEALRIVATLPSTRAADDVLELVRAGVMRGLSIGFHPISHHIVVGVRVVQRARLTSIAVVDTPQYPASEIEARAAAMAALGRTAPIRRYWW